MLILVDWLTCTLRGISLMDWAKDHLFLMDHKKRLVYVWIWGAFDFLPVMHFYLDDEGSLTVEDF